MTRFFLEPRGTSVICDVSVPLLHVELVLGIIPIQSYVENEKRPTPNCLDFAIYKNITMDVKLMMMMMKNITILLL